MTNYVKRTGVILEKKIFDLKNGPAPPVYLYPIPHKKKTLPISEEGQDFHP